MSTVSTELAPFTLPRALRWCRRMDSTHKEHQP